jgi:hypothetical protein
MFLSRAADREREEGAANLHLLNKPIDKTVLDDSFAPVGSLLGAVGIERWPRLGSPRPFTRY